jgi:hypothetical protein
MGAKLSIYQSQQSTLDDPEYLDVSEIGDEVESDDVVIEAERLLQVIVVEEGQSSLKSKPVI